MIREHCGEKLVRAQSDSAGFAMQCRKCNRVFVQRKRRPVVRAKVACAEQAALDAGLDAWQVWAAEQYAAGRPVYAGDPELARLRSALWERAAEVLVAAGIAPSSVLMCEQELGHSDDFFKAR